MHGGQRPISPQVLTKLSRPPSLCHQCTPVVFLGLINTCGNRNGWRWSCGCGGHVVVVVVMVVGVVGVVLELTKVNFLC